LNCTVKAGTGGGLGTGDNRFTLRCGNGFLGEMADRAVGAEQIDNWSHGRFPWKQNPIIANTQAEMLAKMC
jgi:hypothetical protein